MGILKNDKLIIGYDLGNSFSQISYALSPTGEVETLSQVTGAQAYNIPTVLCKRRGVNQWFFGKEALKHAEEQQGILVKNLVQLARDGEPVIIEENSYHPVALLTLFVKRSLGLLTQTGFSDKIGAILITCEELDSCMLEVLNQVVAGMNLKGTRITYQNYRESFYEYMLHQPRDLWTEKAVLFRYQEELIKIYILECNKRTTPVVAFVEEAEADFPKAPALEDTLPKELQEKMDGAFLQLAKNVFQNQNVTSVFLIGDGFAQGWMEDSLRYLCRGRRVFQGTNLFSKGACHGMQEKLQASEISKDYLFLGEDKLKANIGMEVLRQGESSYLALLDAGVNWYEAEQTAQVYIQDGNQISFQITPLIGKESRTVEFKLEDLPEGVSRLRVSLSMAAENKLVVNIEDLGFGEFRLPSGRIWEKTIEIY